MKNIYPFVFTLLILASCSTSKDYLSRIDEDKTFFDAVKSINKHADDSDAVKALPVLYSHTQETPAQDRQLQQFNRNDPLG